MCPKNVIGLFMIIPCGGHALALSGYTHTHIEPKDRLLGPHRNGKEKTSSFYEYASVFAQPPERYRSP